MRLSRTLARAGRLAVDARGAAAVEFALLVPVLCFLYFGAAEVMQGILSARRAAHAASTIGDLVAQSSSVTQAEVGQIFTMGNAVLYPYPTAPLKMRITSVVADAQGNTTVAWSQGSGMTALSKGASVSVSSNVISANQSVVMAEVQYTYTPIIGYVLKSSIPFTDTYYLRPRLSSQVSCADC